jgi:alpha-aminoadipic semialdehyde synthase
MKPYRCGDSGGSAGVRIGIRREDKSVWERRVPITPDGALDLIDGHGLEVWVQPSEIRVFSNADYRQAGARVREDLSTCPVVFGVKEMPAHVFQPGHTYVFFAHVIKGQRYNMAMLRQLLEMGCQLIDYEKVTDEDGRRLIFFGRHAGMAGMIDTLWALGKRLEWEGVDNPFSQLRLPHEYESLAAAKEAVSGLGDQLARDGLPAEIAPLICGFAGYGNVFRGADEIIRLLPVEEIEPREVEGVAAGARSRDRLYKVVFKEEHTVQPISAERAFDLRDYYDHPQRYRSCFAQYLPHLSVLVNCVYWEAKYPRLVTKADVRRLYGGAEKPRLRVIGDISCDIEGAIECTIMSTEPGDPVYVYDPATDKALDGVAGTGPVIMAVDILPSELPRAASVYFSGVLTRYVPAIAEADYSVRFGELDLPAEIKKAVIAYQGRLTPDYRYIEEYLRG